MVMEFADLLLPAVEMQIYESTSSRIPDVYNPTQFSRYGLRINLTP